MCISSGLAVYPTMPAGIWILLADITTAFIRCLLLFFVLSVLFFAVVMYTFYDYRYYPDQAND
jgi:hypothetical protein